MRILGKSLVGIGIALIVLAGLGLPYVAYIAITSQQGIYDPRMWFCPFGAVASFSGVILFNCGLLILRGRNA